ASGHYFQQERRPRRPGKSPGPQFTKMPILMTEPTTRMDLPCASAQGAFHMEMTTRGCRITTKRRPETKIKKIRRCRKRHVLHDEDRCSSCRPTLTARSTRRRIPQTPATNALD